MSRIEGLSAAEEALKKAAELSADTHLARAQHLYYALRDYNGALSELDLARQGLPNDPRVVELTGYILRRQGKLEEGVRALQSQIAKAIADQLQAKPNVVRFDLQQTLKRCRRLRISPQGHVAIENLPSHRVDRLDKLMPFWDPLRGDPRFEKIVESLAPKEK